MLINKIQSANKMITYINCIISVLLFSSVNSQYNIIRINPFKQLSETLKAHTVQESDRGAMSLNCPEGTKVGC